MECSGPKRLLSAGALVEQDEHISVVQSHVHEGVLEAKDYTLTWMFIRGTEGVLEVKD